MLTWFSVKCNHISFCYYPLLIINTHKIVYSATLLIFLFNITINKKSIPALFINCILYKHAQLLTSFRIIVYFPEFCFIIKCHLLRFPRNSTILLLYFAVLFYCFIHK